MATSLTRRVFRAGSVGVTATAVVLACSSWSPNRSAETDYCATMPDSVGLYVGNPITQMGYQIGEVSAISPTLDSVRIDFKLVINRPLPADVRAVTRSTSILADRALELVGNYTSGPQLGRDCIPLSRSSTPKSLSETVGAATNFLNALNPEGSTNIGGVVAGVDQALRNTGPRINDLLTTSSAVLDAPDRAISDIRSIIVNLVELTSTLRDVSGPLKASLLATYQTTPDVMMALHGAARTFDALVPLIDLISDLEVHLGDQFQVLYNDLEYALRKSSAHSAMLAVLLKSAPVIINKLENWVNRKQFNIRYRPPLYRIATPVDGLITCGRLNAASPGSCADVAGKPYAVDVALLQYVLARAAQQ